MSNDATTLYAEVKAIIGNRARVHDEGARVYLELHSWEPDFIEPYDSDDPDEHRQAVRHDNWQIGLANTAAGLQHMLLDAGLTLVGTDPNIALAKGEAIEVIRRT